MKIFCDTNVILDFVDEDRDDHSVVVESLQKINQREGKLYCSWHTLSTVDYILNQRKKWDEKKVLETIKAIIEHFEIPSVGKKEALEALEYSNGDYEDAMQIVTALKGEVTLILSNDRSGGFEKSPLTVESPSDFIKS